ncbi:MAG: hypothetical protein ACLQDM_02725 [Bradyrhizobium sp.]
MSSTRDEWPAYQTGPRESIFAMGVVSVKFAELESILTFMFATVLGIGIDTATKIISKIGIGPCLQLTSQMLATKKWSRATVELVEYFLEGAAICTENRNHLMHSNLAWTGDEHTVLFKTTKQGNTMIAVPRPSELRRIADDINEFILYGRQLANAINNTSEEVPIFPAFPWPNKPRKPVALKFTSEPVTLRKEE